ncbi:MAG: hypothetical protein ACI9GH_000211 [Candidatus Paceibacteria bacterium]|jgi:hypothetical protein
MYKFTTVYSVSKSLDESGHKFRFLGYFTDKASAVELGKGKGVMSFDAEPEDHHVLRITEGDEVVYFDSGSMTSHQPIEVHEDMQSYIDSKVGALKKTL